MIRKLLGLGKKQNKTVEIDKSMKVAFVGADHSGKSSLIEILAGIFIDKGIRTNIFSKDIYNKISAKQDESLDHDESIYVDEKLRVLNNDVGTGGCFLDKSQDSISIYEYKIEDLFTLNRQLTYADKIVIIQDLDVDSAQINQVAFNDENIAIVFNKFIVSKVKLKHFEMIYGKKNVENALVNNMDMNLYRASVNSKLSKDLMKYSEVGEETIRNMEYLCDWILDGVIKDDAEMA